MLKALIKKQFTEIFRGYFVNAKTGQARSRGGSVGMFILYAVIILFLCSVFFGTGFTLSPLLSTGYSWLYFALMGILSLALGVFGSVFNTFASLYLAKDNELLLSMPIPPAYVLLSRLSSVFGLALLYSGAVWVPGMIAAWIFGPVSFSRVILPVLLTFVIALVVTVLTAALGWVVALIASRLKNKSVITVIVSLVLIGGYYYLSSRAGMFITTIVEDPTGLGNGIQKWGNVFYQLGRAAEGNVLVFLLFLLAAVALALLCFLILSRSFVRLTQGVNKSENKKGTARTSAVRSADTALLLRELKRFASSSTYMLNCGLGLVMMTLVAIVLLIRGNALQNVLSDMILNEPALESFLPLAALSLVAVLSSLNFITAPSFSLEGKHLWILKSLPVKPLQVIRAKKRTHLLLCLLPTLFASVVVPVILGCDALSVFLCVVTDLLFLYFSADFGLFLGLKNVNLQWTNEAMPIKQSVSGLIAMFSGLGVPLVFGGLYGLLFRVLDVRLWMLVCIAILVLTDYLLDRWLARGGVKLYLEL